MAKSRYVCARCGLPVHLWGKPNGGDYWKHSGGWRSEPACGKPPVVTERDAYERRMREFREALGLRWEAQGHGNRDGS